MPLAFIGGTEILGIMLLGLLLFGGKLPDVAKDMGRVFFRAKRSLDEIRQESGIDDAIRDLQRETRDLDRTARDIAEEARKAAEDVPDWRQSLDPTAGPDPTISSAEPEELESEESGPSEAEKPAGETPDETDSQQESPKPDSAS
jgi:Sec-independent protein translocase protein TatA